MKLIATSDSLGKALNEAARWYARRQSGAMTSDERMNFEAWKVRDPKNADAWLAMETAHRDAEGLIALPELDDLRAEALAPPAGAGPYGRWRLAASVAILLAGTVGTYAFLRRNEPPIMAASVAPQLYETAVGQMRTIRLPDGSRVTLNTDTALNVPAWTDQRRITLVRGEAYFRVAKDKTRPFAVDMTDGYVQAVGTEFSVRRMSRGFRVALAEGRVKILIPAHGPAEMLEHGQQLSFDGRTTRRETTGVADATRWLSGELTLKDVTLADAVVEVNRYSSCKIVLRDASAAQRKLSGVFKTGDVDTFVEAVTAYGMARVESRTAREIRLRGI
ncbi:MAG: FecR domain-containing protein [Novosphingobium sp.]